jgi:hypothetical protein
MQERMNLKRNEKWKVKDTRSEWKGNKFKLRIDFCGGRAGIEYWRNHIPVGQSHSFDRQIKLQRFEILVVVTMNSTVFYNKVETYRRFERVCCLKLQDKFLSYYTVSQVQTNRCQNISVWAQKQRRVRADELVQSCAHQLCLLILR